MGTWTGITAPGGASGGTCTCMGIPLGPSITICLDGGSCGGTRTCKVVYGNGIICGGGIMCGGGTTCGGGIICVKGVLVIVGVGAGVGVMSCKELRGGEANAARLIPVELTGGSDTDGVSSVGTVVPCEIMDGDTLSSKADWSGAMTNFLGAVSGE